MIDSTAPDIRRALQRARRYTTACWDANEGNLDADALVRLAARLDAEAHGEGSTLSADLVLSRQWNAEFDARAANTR